jgi:pimeloyl-ACP methyl ester carboxylesterase
MNDPAGSYEERRAPNGLYYRVTGRGAPLLLLHGLMASGLMFDPLVDLLCDDFRLVIPDLRGHGQSGGMGGPYDVAAMASDLDAVIAEEGRARVNVLGYSHGGAVAQELARVSPQAVAKLFLVCTYACNVATLREYLEGLALLSLLSVVSPRAVAGVMLWFGRSSMPGMTQEKTAWMSEIIGANDRKKMRAAAKGLLTFDSRPWLKDISVPTLVVAGAEDAGVPAHHFKALMFGISGALGTVVQGAGHTLLWTHTQKLADLIRAHAAGPNSCP